MQFIETLFGLIPDGGSGILEFSLIAILLTAMAVPLVLRRAAKPRETRTNPRT